MVNSAAAAKSPNEPTRSRRRAGLSKSWISSNARCGYSIANRLGTPTVRSSLSARGHYHPYAPEAAAAVMEELTLLASQLTLTEFAASSGSCRSADNLHGSDPRASSFPADRFENRPPPGLYRYRG